MPPAMKRTQIWLPATLPNLFQLKESGIQCVRVKPRKQKTGQRSLPTDSFSDARGRMLDLRVVKRAAAGSWGSLVEPWRAWLEEQKVKKKFGGSIIDYELELSDAIRITSPGWDKFPLSDVTEKRLDGWLVAHSAKYSPTRTTGAITVLRKLLAIAVRDKVRSREQVSPAPRHCASL